MLSHCIIGNGVDLKFGGLVLIIVTSLHFSAAFAQLPEVTMGTCNVTKISYVTSSASTTTRITTNFVTLPDMRIYFDVTEGQCVRSEFSVVLGGPAADNIQIRALFDDNPAVTAPDSVEILPWLPIGYRVFTFIVPIESGLGPGGNHNVQIQVRGNHGGSLVTLKRSLIVYHN